MAKRDITIKTKDGEAKAGLFTPTSTTANQPGVILYMDAFGPRPALDAMAERLAGEGYVVLVPDLFYRSGPYQFDAKTAFNDPANREKLMGMMQATTQNLTVGDSAAFIDALTKEGGASGRIGAVGYCMGGSRAMNAAAAYPDRIAAVASFHGGNLAGDALDAPVNRVGSIKGRVYVGAAGVDKSFPPEQSAKLAKALREAEVDHVIENYVGMEHGWAVSDHGVYDEKGAERHWKRLLTFFEETLKA